MQVPQRHRSVCEASFFLSSGACFTASSNLMSLIQSWGVFFNYVGPPKWL